MSASRTVSFSGVLVALACTLAACGSNNNDDQQANNNATSPAVATSTPPVSQNAQRTIDATKNDPPACNFFTAKEIASKLLPSVKVAHGIPTSCTYSTTAKSAAPSIGFVYISKGLITSTIANSANTKQTITGAWAAQKKLAHQQPGYTNVSGVGDSAYAQLTKGTSTLLWFVKDHAFYLTYNYDPSSKKGKNLITLADLKKFSSSVPNPSTVSTKTTSATEPDGASVTTQ